MDKKTFKEIMTEFLAIKKDEKTLRAAYREAGVDCFDMLLGGKYENLAIKILSEAMEDKDDWIGYWMYEIDCGSKAKKDSAQNSNGKPIPIKTIDDLWNILIKK